MNNTIQKGNSIIKTYIALLLFNLNGIILNHSKF